jgi:hypothetical protein
VVQLAYSRLRAEAVAVLDPPWRVLRANKLTAFPIALTCTVLIGLFALIQHTTAGWWVVEHVAGVYQALPLHLILLRLPLSMLAPAPDLPAWGAMLQVLVVFALSEVHLGRLRTLITAVCVNGLTTVSARIMVIVGLHLAIGTPQVDQYELDTGPSTVVVALCIYIGLKCRAYLVLAITAAAMTAEAVALPNLAGREHLVALGLGVAAYLIGERRLLSRLGFSKLHFPRLRLLGARLLRPRPLRPRFSPPGLPAAAAAPVPPPASTITAPAPPAPVIAPQAGAGPAAPATAGNPLPLARDAAPPRPTLQP